MTKRLIGVMACLLLAALDVRGQAPAAPTPPQSPPGGETRDAAPAPAEAREMPATLAGLWKSAPERTQLTGAFEESVWGRDASSERNVEMKIDRKGEATLTVTTRILDAKGKVVRGPTSIETSRLRIGGPTRTTAAGTDYAVTVESAERRYPDDPEGTWMIDGLKVRVITREEDDSVEIRYDTPEGRGSFWQTLTRDGKPARPRASSQAGSK